MQESGRTETCADRDRRQTERAHGWRQAWMETVAEQRGCTGVGAGGPHGGWTARRRRQSTYVGGGVSGGRRRRTGVERSGRGGGGLSRDTGVKMPHGRAGRAGGKVEQGATGDGREIWQGVARGQVCVNEALPVWTGSVIRSTKVNVTSVNHIDESYVNFHQHLQHNQQTLC
jgi:hypothetical protein